MSEENSVAYSNAIKEASKRRKHAHMERGGQVGGKFHKDGGTPFVLQDTGTEIEEEKYEINIPREIVDDQTEYEFKGSNYQILNKILKKGGLSLNDKVSSVKSGDIVICVVSAWDDTKRTYKGTLKQILSAINESGGCKKIEDGAVVVDHEKGDGNKMQGGGDITPDIQAILSHLYQEHHQAFDLTKRLCENGEQSLRAKADIIHQIYQDELKHHFEEEESIVFPKLISIDSAFHPKVDELIEDHREFERLVQNIGTDPTQDQIDWFCKLLQHHIIEEEKLFKSIAPDPFNSIEDQSIIKHEIKVVDFDGVEHTIEVGDISSDDAKNVIESSFPQYQYFSYKEWMCHGPQIINSEIIEQVIVEEPIELKKGGQLSSEEKKYKELEKQLWTLEKQKQDIEKKRLQAVRVWNMDKIKEYDEKISRNKSEGDSLITEIKGILRTIEIRKMLGSKEEFDRNLVLLKTASTYLKGDKKKNIQERIEALETAGSNIQFSDGGNIPPVVPEQKEITISPLSCTPEELEELLQGIPDHKSKKKAVSLINEVRDSIQHGRFSLYKVVWLKDPDQWTATEIGRDFVVESHLADNYVKNYVLNEDRISDGAQPYLITISMSESGVDWNETILSHALFENGEVKIRTERMIWIDNIEKFIPDSNIPQMQEGGEAGDDSISQESTGEANEELPDENKERSIMDVVDQRLRAWEEKKKIDKNLRDSSVRIHGSKKEISEYRKIEYSDLKDLEADAYVASKLVRKERVYPKVDIEEEKKLGATSGAIFLKVKIREAFNSAPSDTPETRDLYVLIVENLVLHLSACMTVSEVKTILYSTFSPYRFSYKTFGIKTIDETPEGKDGEIKWEKIKEKFIKIYGYTLSNGYEGIVGKRFSNLCNSSNEIYAQAKGYESISAEQESVNLENWNSKEKQQIDTFSNTIMEYRIMEHDRLKREIRNRWKMSRYWRSEYLRNPEVFREWVIKKYYEPKLEVHKERLNNLPSNQLQREESWDWMDKKRKERTVTDEPKINSYVPLSYIERKGGIKVKEEWLSIDYIEKNFGYRAIEWGKYVPEPERKEMTRHFIGSMFDLSEVLDINLSQVNKLGGLVITFASRGAGSRAMATYNSGQKLINLTRKRGDGSVAHEWGHFFDNISYEKDRISGSAKWSTKDAWDNLKDYYQKRPSENDKLGTAFYDLMEYIKTGGDKAYIDYTFFVNDFNSEDAWKYKSSIELQETFEETLAELQKSRSSWRNYGVGIMYDLKSRIGYILDHFKLENTTIKLKLNTSRYYHFSSQFKSKYWIDPVELFARAWECYIWDKLKDKGFANNYLVASSYDGLGYYPQGEERAHMIGLINTVVQEFKEKYNIGPFEMPSDTEREDLFIEIPVEERKEKVVETQADEEVVENVEGGESTIDEIESQEKEEEKIEEVAKAIQQSDVQEEQIQQQEINEEKKVLMGNGIKVSGIEIDHVKSDIITENIIKVCFKHIPDPLFLDTIKSYGFKYDDFLSCWTQLYNNELWKIVEEMSVAYGQGALQEHLEEKRRILAGVNLDIDKQYEIQLDRLLSDIDHKKNEYSPERTLYKFKSTADLKTANELYLGLVNKSKDLEEKMKKLKLLALRQKGNSNRLRLQQGEE